MVPGYGNTYGPSPTRAGAARGRAVPAGLTFGRTSSPKSGSLKTRATPLLIWLTSWAEKTETKGVANERDGPGWMRHRRRLCRGFPCGVVRSSSELGREGGGDHPGRAQKRRRVHRQGRG